MATKTTAVKTTKKPVKASPAAPAAATSPAQPKQKNKVVTVTSLNLKRTLISDGYRGKFFMEHETYTQLNLLGMQLGCTWDEVLRGIVDMSLASSDPLSALKNFVPALQ